MYTLEMVKPNWLKLDATVIEVGINGVNAQQVKVRRRWLDDACNEEQRIAAVITTAGEFAP
ncbi:hypothetical protein [Mesorhizobium sp. M0040]|uniref:hypothetical protein n=1 Tax=Mesorhizobium sp. M0040 TaxID=2956855 RepID=UPI00333AE1A4